MPLANLLSSLEGGNWFLALTFLYSRGKSFPGAPLTPSAVRSTDLVFSLPPSLHEVSGTPCGRAWNARAGSPGFQQCRGTGKDPPGLPGTQMAHSRTHLELLPLMMMQEQDISHPFLGGPEGRCTMGSPIWPKPQVASVCHQPDRSVLGHKSHVACPWTVPLLSLPSSSSQSVS